MERKKNSSVKLIYFIPKREKLPSNLRHFDFSIAFDKKNNIMSSVICIVIHIYYIFNMTYDTFLEYLFVA